MAAASAVIAPFFWKGSASGHDITFHITCWMEAAGQWREGIFYPRWAEWANYGFGEARFIFYPPLSWMLGAALGTILPWKAVAGAMIWLLLTLAGATMYRLARESMPPGDAALAAVLFAVNPYHLVLVYFRSDYAELLVSALFPLVVLYTLRLSSMAGPAAAPQGRALGRLYAAGMVPLALLVGAIWLSNAPAALIVAYSLVLLLTVLALLRRSFSVLLAGGAALALGLLLAAFYIVPAAYEQGWVNIAEILSKGLRPEENFLFTMINDPEHNLFNLMVSTVAAAMMGVAGISAVASNRLKDSANKEQSMLWWALLALAAAASGLMFPVSSVAWHWLPKLRFVQFPWRWLFPLGVAFAYLFAAALRHSRLRLAWAVLAMAALTALAVFLVNHTWWDTQDAPAAEASIRQGQGYEGTDEYDTRGTDHYDLPKGAHRVTVLPAGGLDTTAATAPQQAPKIHIQEWSAETKLFTVQSAEPITIAPRLRSYPAWKAEVNGHAVGLDAQEGTGQMLIQVPAGSSRVRIHFTRTSDRTLGAAISSAAALVLLALAKSARGGATNLPPAPGAGRQGQG